MALLPFQYQEFSLANHRGFSLDYENDMRSSPLPLDTQVIDPRLETPAELKVDLLGELVGFAYEHRVINVFEGDLRVLGRKATHSFFLTESTEYFGTYTHLTVIASDPNKYLSGPLGSNMKRAAQGNLGQYQTDARMRKLLQFAREF